MKQKEKDSQRSIRRLCGTLLSFCLISFSTFAQISIKGTVTDSSGEPIVGATVLEKQKRNNGTVTDINGNFSLKVASASSSLRISYIGMKTSETEITPNKPMKIVLLDDSQMLDEVVSIGYATSKRADLTGSVASIGEKVLKDIPVSNVMDALSGRLAGVNIVRSEGSPDSDFAITIRGGGSITQDNTPLFIVDGFEVNDIKDIPPKDIQSIDVLKDASSTAIYGSQGANGVILITTKSGQAGRTSVSFNAQVGFNRVYNLTKVLSPYEYVYYQRELDSSPTAGFFSNFGLWEDMDIYKGKAGNDWQNTLFGNTGIQQSYNVTLSGGDKSNSFNVSFTHDDENYTLKQSNLTRDNLSLKFNREINKNLRFDISGRLTHRVVGGPSVSNGRKLNEAVKYAPIKTLPDLSAEDIVSGSDEEDLGDAYDPVANIEKTYSKQYYLMQTYNAGLSWKFLRNFSLRTQGSLSLYRDYSDLISVVGTKTATYNGGRPVAERRDNKGERWQWTNTLNYENTFAKQHRLKVLLGQEITHSQNRQMYTYTKNFPVDFTAEQILPMWSYGESSTTSTRIDEPIRTFSYFGRADYSFDNRYYLTLTARGDGKSVFSPENRWGFFPGAAVAWRLSQEKFLQSQKEWLSNLKLRLSYGAVGNARITPNWRPELEAETNQSSMIYPNGNPANVLRPGTTMYNRDLTWESKISLNAAVDFGFFNERINGTVEFYRDIIQDLIMQVQIPSHSGYTTQFQNVGQTSNQGVDITLNGNIVNSRDFQLSANFNINFNQNRVDRIDDRGGKFNNQSSGIKWDYGSNEFMVEVGKPLGLMYGYVCEGMYSFDDFNWDDSKKIWMLKPGGTDISTLANTGNLYGPGHIKLKDLDGDGKITEAGDREIIGIAQPLFTGGFGISMSWKGFDFSTLFNFVYGQNILNGSKVDYTTYTGSKKFWNLSTEMDLEHRFTTIDPETGQNIYYGAYANPERLKEINQNASIWHPITNRSIFSSWVVEDGSYLRWSNLTLGYTLPTKLTKKILIQKLRFYVNGNNLFCFTKYSGQDPEVNMNTKNSMTQGVDYNAYPKSRTFVVGANITF